MLCEHIDIIKLVLAVGNYMNNGTNRGNCVGFELQFLMNLRGVKVTDASTDIKNLLQLLVDISSRADENGIVRQIDCTHVQAATRVAVKHMIGQLKLMDSSIHRIRTEVNAVIEKADERETRFGLIMQIFVNKAASQLKLLRHTASDLEDKLEQVWFFGDLQSR